MSGSQDDGHTVAPVRVTGGAGTVEPVHVRDAKGPDHVAVTVAGTAHTANPAAVQKVGAGTVDQNERSDTDAHALAASLIHAVTLLRTSLSNTQIIYTN